MDSQDAYLDTFLDSCLDRSLDASLDDICLDRCPDLSLDLYPTPLLDPSLKPFPEQGNLVKCIDNYSGAAQTVVHFRLKALDNNFRDNFSLFKLKRIKVAYGQKNHLNANKS